MILTTLVPLLASLASLTPVKAAPQPHNHLTRRGVNLGFPYGQEKIRGVNLGGWLVLEPWITPSLFENTGNEGIIDEWTFGQYQDYNTARNALVNHWNSWITEGDIQQIASAGLNHVRVPIGFWAYDISGGEPYIQGQAEYLDRVIGWARNAGVKVMIDLHGAPGSQNGYDNSGRRGQALWATDGNNVNRAKNVIQTLSEKYSDPYYWQVVTSLCLLNEPATYINDQLLQTTRQYWYDAYGAGRYPWAPQGSASKSGLALIISDGFQPLDTFNGFMNEPNFESVLIDSHNYQVFSDEMNRWNWPTHIQQICAKGSQYASSPLWTFIGEWSLADTDCAQYLNGRGVGSRYDGSYPGSGFIGDCRYKTGDGSTFSEEYKGFLRQFWDVQTQTYENNGVGWVFWTWKNERAAEWSYSRGLEMGWIPYNPNEHVNSIQALCG